MPTGDSEIAFHVRDESLGTIHSCVATWDGVRSDYDGLDADTFNLITGEPEADVFSTGAGCGYDGHSRIVADPAPEAFDDGNAIFVGYDPVRLAETEEFRLISDLNAGSRLEVRYFFHVVDTYDADAMRARVTSPSDEGGEWADLKEVRSETDDEPSATSGLFLGRMGVSRNPVAKGLGDGSVWVPSGESVKVSYLDEEGVVKGTSDTSPRPSPTPLVSPTPTNVPGLYGDPFPTPTSTVVPGPPNRSVSTKFARIPAQDEETVVVFIRDNHLGTTERCSVTWTDLPDEVAANSSWDVVSGDPHPGVFSNEECGYDASTSACALP